jgi:hypothetical protein
MRKIIPILVMMLMIAGTALPVLGNIEQYEFSGRNNSNHVNRELTLDVAITTDWVNGWQDHGLLIREFSIDEEVYAYSEISSDDLYGLYFTQRWWYDNGTGLENKWEYSWTIQEHWTSSASWTWWEIGFDYGKGVGYIETLVDNVSLGDSNWYAIDNTQPDKPTIDGEAEGQINDEYEYVLMAVEPDGHDISYYVDWGDETNSGWTDFVASGTEETLTHTWMEEGDYIIQCKVKDLFDNESEWETLEITMPVSQQTTSYPILERIVARFPNAFPILQRILGI